MQQTIMATKDKGKKLEDYKPGASKEEVHDALRKVALFKPKKKHEQSDKASS